MCVAPGVLPRVLTLAAQYVESFAARLRLGTRPFEDARASRDDRVGTGRDIDLDVILHLAINFKREVCHGGYGGRR